MKAYRCERCGVFYDRYPLIDVERKFLGKPLVVGAVKKSGKIKPYDLCPSCSDRLISFMTENRDNYGDAKQKSVDGKTKKEKKVIGFAVGTEEDE